MGYDRFPEHIVDEKTRILGQLAREHAHNFFTHDRSVAWARVVQDEKGKFSASEPSDGAAWLAI
jgi:hypothetical protein